MRKKIPENLIRLEEALIAARKDKVNFLIVLD